MIKKKRKRFEKQCSWQKVSLTLLLTLVTGDPWNLSACCELSLTLMKLVLMSFWRINLDIYITEITHFAHYHKSINRQLNVNFQVKKGLAYILYYGMTPKNNNLIFS